jgi:hypothetical protein
MFVVDLERTAAVLDGMKSEGRLYWAVIGPVRLDGHDVTRTLSSQLARARCFSMQVRR